MAKVHDSATDLITFARSSSGTALRRVGYGDELVTNRTFDTDTDWTKGTGWTINTTTGVASNDGTINAIYQAKPIEAGKLYACTVDITFNAAGVAYWRLGNLTNLGVMAVNRTSYTQYLLGSADGNYIGIFTNTDITIDNISVREVIFDRATDPLVLFNHPDDIPRIEYGSDGSLKGLLIEEQRTNLITYSEDLNLSFASQTGVSIEPAVATQGPILTSQRMVADTSTGFHRAAGTLPVQNSTDYTFSCFFKADGQDVCGLGVYTGTTFVARASFDLSTVQETVSNGSATIKSVGGDWYHCAVTGTTTGASATIYIYVNSLFSATGDDTSGIYVYGAQLEAGSFATSYIPTSGSQETRWADVASIPVSAFGYNQTAGTVVVEVDSIKAGVSQRLLSINNSANTSGERTDLLNNAGSQNVQHFTVDGGTTQTDHSLSVAGLTSFKIAATIAPDDYSMCVNGGTVVAETDGTPTVPTVDTFRLGGGVSSPLNGHIKSIQYYPRRLTNTQLQELTA